MSEDPPIYAEPEGRPGTQQSNSPMKRGMSNFNLSRKSIDRPNLLLNSIRGRHSSAVSRHMNPKWATDVIREYLLPMFEADNRHILAKGRANVFGLSNLDAPKEITDYKLSDRLTTELNNTHSQLQELNNKLETTEFDTGAMKDELYNLRLEYLKSSCELRILEILKQANNKDRVKRADDVQSCQDQANRSKLISIERSEENSKIATELHQEITLNESLKTMAIELDHGNGLLNMENDIMGERLKGLYEAISQVSNPSNLEDVFENEMDMLQGKANDLSTTYNDLTKTIGKTMRDTTAILHTTTASSRNRAEMFTENYNLKVYLKDNTDKLMYDSSTLQEECEALDSELTKQSKRAKDLTEQCDKLRQRTRQFNQNKKSENEEKQCKNCNKYYMENENRNWSCRTHSSQFMDQYWCCGKTTEGAPGCIVQKHIPREDEEDEMDPKEKEEMQKQANANQMCRSCKQFGHRQEVCNRDPNIRTNFNQAEEVNRIGDQYLDAHRTKQDQQEIADLVESEAMLGGKMTSLSKIGVPPSPPSPKLHEQTFGELDDLRALMTFDTEENLVSVDEIFTKELDKETLATSRAKANASAYSGSNNSSKLNVIPPFDSFFNRQHPNMDNLLTDDYMSMDSTDRGIASEFDTPLFNTGDHFNENKPIYGKKFDGRPPRP